MSGIAVEWDHSAPPYQRNKSIHFTSDEDDHVVYDVVDPLDLIDFVEQKDGSGTRVEVKQRKVTKGRELEDDRVYRVVRPFYIAPRWCMACGGRSMSEHARGQIRCGCD